MSPAPIRRWVATLKPVVQAESMPAELVEAIKRDDADWILAWIEQEFAAAVAERDAFVRQWAHLEQRKRRAEAEYHRELDRWYNDFDYRGARPELVYDAEVEWFIGELGDRDERIRALEYCRRSARDVAGVEPWPVVGVPAVERRQDAERAAALDNAVAQGSPADAGSIDAQGDDDHPG